MTTLIEFNYYLNIPIHNWFNSI